MLGRSQKYLPIVLVALMVQILAPIGACWAAAIAASNPLGTAVICHDTAASGPAEPDKNGRHGDHAGACATCCLVSAATSIDTPRVDGFAFPYRETMRVAWHVQPDSSGSRVGSSAQARAPPQSM